MRIKTLLLLSLFTLQCSIISATIPTPKSRTTISNQGCTITPNMLLTYESSLEPLKDYILEYLPLGNSSTNSSSNNSFTIGCDSTLAQEAYRLTVKPNHIEIMGGSYGGVFNGVQTLFQQLPSEIYTKQISLPITIKESFTIEDAPRFDYRGMMLDVARTWIGVDGVKRKIDLLSYHKLNKLHLHLTDDEGWRIEIQSHPELTSIAGFRGGDSPVQAEYGKWDQKYGGFFTQEQLKDIIAYAAIRNIEIIPEIDLPGHSRTVAKVYPEILCNYESSNTASNGCDLRSAWCVAKESNYTLLEDILREVCQLFPSKHIHIGGDEVNLSQWKKCPDCTKIMKDRAMTDPHQLEDLFIAKATEILESYGKMPAVWDEAINGGGLNTKTHVYGWQNVKACLKATERGYPTVVMPANYFYIDMRQGKHDVGHNWATTIDTKRSYSFNFTKEGFTPAQMENVIGLEMPFWSETYTSKDTDSPDYLDYMCFPRLCALAELAWSGKGREWDFLNTKLIDRHYDRMSQMDIQFRLSEPKIDYTDGILKVSVDDGSQIYYTNDGRTKPTAESTPYTGAIKTTTPQLYQFRNYYGTGEGPISAHSSFYKIITPALKFTTTMGESTKTPYSNIEKYRTFARTLRACRKGDVVTYTFTNPLSCRDIYLQTGYSQLAKSIIATGDVEISRDGINFEKAGEIEQGSATLYDLKGIKTIRIVSTYNDFSTNFVVIQMPRIKR